MRLLTRNLGKNRVAPVLALVACLLAVSPQAKSTAEQPGDRGPLNWRLACRLASYGKYQDAAWNHLPSIGVYHVFLSVPEPHEIAAVQQRLDAHRLTPLVMRGQADLGEPQSVDKLAGQLAVCAQMGVRYMFFSPKHTGATKETAYDRLRRAGEIARQHGVIIALETHPDLGTNGDVHRETMKHVDHPNVRVNFDTGNITYYNQGADGTERGHS